MNYKTNPYYARKIFATIIDYGLFLMATILYTMLIGSPNDQGVYSVNGVPALIIPTLWFLYFIIIEGEYSNTLGHYFLNLKVVQTNGQKISIKHSLKRRLLDIIDLFFYGIPALITISKTPNNQRLGDLWAETLVVHKDDVEHIKKYFNNEK